MAQQVHTDVRLRLAASLRRDAALHRLRRHAQMGGGYAELRASLPPARDPATLRLAVALDFWDAWLFARDGGWVVVDHMPPALWPSLALLVAADLAANRDITDPRVQMAYDLSMTFRAPGYIASSLAERLVADETRPVYA